MNPIEVGERAPAFALRDQTGAVRRLSEFRGRPVVMFFYPEDDSELCTAETCGFRDGVPDFLSLGAAVLGISPDGVESHARFASKINLIKMDLLSDPAGSDGMPKVCQTYGVWREKVLYGRRYIGMVRTTYLIDGSGRVARRWDHVRVKGHAEAVLQAVRGLGDHGKSGPKPAPKGKRGVAGRAPTIRR